MACLRLSLLGSFEAKLDGEPVTGFPTTKTQALLAYLAVEAHRAHRREVLSALLWPDWPERAARTNLRNALSKLRTAIGDRQETPPYLCITRETVQFNAASAHWLDVAAFRDLVTTDQSGNAACDRLQQAIAVYRGPFLEGLSVGDSRAFEDWAFLVRERLQRRALAALQRLVGHYERQGEVTRACEHAWRWVELAPWQEQAHRALMRCLALSGQRGAALAQYEACCRALKDELDVEPGEETARLYERIRDGELSPAPQKAKAHESAPPAGVPVQGWRPEMPSVVAPDPAPAPATAAPVGTPVSTKKGLPGWVWGVIGALGTLVLLIVAGAALLANQGEGASSTTPPSPADERQAYYNDFDGDPSVAPAMPYGVEPQEGKYVDLCKDVTPPQICIRDDKTGQVTQVTSNLDFGLMEGPGWSPDGQQILFSAGPDPEVTGGWDHKLYRIQVKEPLPSTDRSDLRQITAGYTNDLDPAWSPDGEWIAFHRNCGLWIVRPDGSGARMLLAGTEALCTDWPAWSPDSQQIAFSNTRAPFIEVWVIDADGSDPRLIYAFERRLEWGSPGWSPDGRQIACWYTDGREEKSLLIYLDGSDQPRIVDQPPRWWFRSYWPQWGG